MPTRPRPEPAPEPAPTEEPSILDQDIEIPRSIHIGTVPGSLSGLAGLQAMRIPMPSLHLPRISDSGTARHHVDLSNVDDARRALIERIVLGPPRCMKPDPDEFHV